MRHLPADFEEVTNGVGGPARPICCAVYSGQRATLSVGLPLPPHLIQVSGLSSQAFVLAVMLACYHVGVVGSGNPNQAPHLFLARHSSIELSPQLPTCKSKTVMIFVCSKWLLIKI